MKRAFITGGSGFVGANLVRRLLADGHEVHVLLREAHDPWRLTDVIGDVSVHAGAVADPDKVAAALAAAKPDWIFHLAAYGAYATQADPAAAARTNAFGTVAVLEASAARGFEAFVHAGSSSEYGPKDHAPAEDELVAPNSAYAATKVAATVYGQYVARRDGSRVVTMRVYSAYGPFEEPSRLIPVLVVHALERRLPPLADPRIARDYIHVADVCDALVRGTASRPGTGAVYNVATGRQTSLRDLVDLSRTAFAIDAEPEWGSFPARAWDTTVWVGDATRLRTELGWHPHVALEEGLRSMSTWVTAEPMRLGRYRSRLPSRALAREDTRRT